MDIGTQFRKEVKIIDSW